MNTLKIINWICTLKQWYHCSYQFKYNICANRRLCRQSHIGEDTKLDISVAKFIVPYWRIKSTMASGCSTGLPAYVAWRAVTTTLHNSQLYPPIWGLWIKPLGLTGLVHWAEQIDVFDAHLDKKNGLESSRLNKAK